MQQSFSALPKLFIQTFAKLILGHFCWFPVKRVVGSPLTVLVILLLAGLILVGLVFAGLFLAVGAGVIFINILILLIMLIVLFAIEGCIMNCIALKPFT
ncbi:unnamed protein product [Clonostachys rhizophaga]|uniref:Uncharacterized protein n=1 Tax=Clonostachys rhizophaga TaxID=160324 RepID=A0A9N9W125_9HYPO|nr:unnamed protein product [Clonostachys rhizophaga]